MQGYRINKKQHDRLYTKMKEMYPEVCSCCMSTLKEKVVDKFNIHHTRYDVNPLDPEFTRFICNSCNKDSSLTLEQIRKQQEKHPLSKLPEPSDPATPKTFQKGELIDKKLRDYLPRRLSESFETNGIDKILYVDFKNDAAEYCGCMPKTIDEHIGPMVSKAEGIYRLYDSPKDDKEYITWRE